MLVIESVINRYLSLDPEVLDKISRFSGKVIKIEITGVNKQLFLFPDNKGIKVSTDYEGTVDTVIRGSPFSLFKMGLATSAADLLLKGEVEISGDTRLGHQFKNMLTQMDIDWSEPLSQLLGDSLAYQLQQSTKKIGHWGRQTAKSIAASLSEYLQEESRDVVTDTELQMFNDAVDRLRDDVDRLEARIKAAAGSKQSE